MRKTALWIQYDGFSSKNYNVFQVNFESGLMQKETLLPSRNINKTTRQNSFISDFYSVTEEPLTLEVNLVYKDRFTDQDIVNAMRWLKQDTYRPLIFESEPENVYYAIPTKIDMSHDTLRKGYFTVQFECNAPYPFTKVQMSPQYACTTTLEDDINSNSVFDTQIVKVQVKTKARGDFLIKNKSTDTELRLIDVPANLKITFDCLNHQIYAVNSNNEEVLINNNKNNHSWIELMAENNTIYAEGNIDFQIIWQGIRI